jgi:hypothetical protein
VNVFQSISDKLLSTISGPAAKRMVAEISRYHRIQASPDYRQAAEMVHETLLAWGLEAELLSYPAKEGTRFWGARMFQEWSAVAGQLRLVAPQSAAQILADFREMRLSLIPRSAPFEGEAELVAPPRKGEEPEDYDGLDVAGKVVLTSGQVMRVHQLAVEERGAVGLIFDGMRNLEPVSPEGALSDALQYTSFWWWNTPRKGFGFALTPRRGRWLRRIVADAQNEEPVRVHARVVSRLYDGAIENVTATIPGQSEDEILLVSHLCHPTPCANDNASGAAATMEVAHALHSLIESGELPRPQRTLRFLWMPEMTGTYAYLATRREQATHSRMIAGLNLDMVGEDQDQCGSVMLIDSPPQSSASFAVDLLERIREELLCTGTSFSQRGRFPLFRYATVPFSGGSDHFIFADPSVGVPMPMLIQWPDRFYHTTADTLEKVSPETLEHSCVLAGTFVYWLATAGPEQVEWLAREMTARFKRRVIAHSQNAVTSHVAGSQDSGSGQKNRPWKQELDFAVDRQQAAFASLCRLQSSFDPRPWARAVRYFATQEWANTQEVLDEGADGFNVQDTPSMPDDDNRFGRIPRRLFPAPVPIAAWARYHSTQMTQRVFAFQKTHKQQSRILPTLALYWADGERTVDEIVRQVRLETGTHAPECIADAFELLADIGAIEW